MTTQNLVSPTYRIIKFISIGLLLVNCAGDGGSGDTSEYLPSTYVYLKASNTKTNQFFGRSLAISNDGTTLVVGAYGESSSATGINGDQTDSSMLHSGAVYIFVKSGDNWSQQAYIKASNTGGGDYFGVSVTIAADGNTIAIGAQNEDSNATGVNGDGTNNASSDSGAVFVFTRSGSVWAQQAYIKASNTGAGDHFGGQVVLSDDGSTLVVGATSEDSTATGVNGDQSNNGASGSGAAYVFVRTGSTWSQQAYIKASNTEASDEFAAGISLSGDGNTLAIGAPAEDSNSTGLNGNQLDNSASDSGAAYVFSRSGSNWSQQAYIKASNSEANDRFSSSLALSDNGDTLAMGSSEDSASSGVNANQADNSANASGAVYVFVRSNTSWSQQVYLKASNPDASDYFGEVAISSDGNVLAVGSQSESGASLGLTGTGAPGDNSASSAGAVYVFKRAGSSWSQTRFLKAPNAEASDRFGFDLSLSGNGLTFAMSSTYEDSAATGINGASSDNSITDSGAVYVLQ